MLRTVQQLDFLAAAPYACPSTYKSMEIVSSVVSGATSVVIILGLLSAPIAI